MGVDGVSDAVDASWRDALINLRTVGESFSRTEDEIQEVLQSFGWEVDDVDAFESAVAMVGEGLKSIITVMAVVRGKATIVDLVKEDMAAEGVSAVPVARPHD